MQSDKKDLAQMDVLLTGLSFLSRTETVEDYLKTRVNSLTVITISSCFLKQNSSSCRIYKKGVLEKEFRVFNFRMKDNLGFRQPLVILMYLVDWLSIAITVFKLKRKYDLYIGVSHSFALIGVIFKKMKIVKEVIYYCIDYYLPHKKINFDLFFIYAINLLDRWMVKSVDMVWLLSERIIQARKIYGKLGADDYKQIIVPLGYSLRLLRAKPIEEIERWTIGFVGTMCIVQGLELLLEAVPLIAREIPELKVRIVGRGPYEEQFKNLVKKRDLEKYFVFHGFIKDEAQVFEIISRCAVAVAPYIVQDDSFIYYADSGKSKLYAFCGVPTIITKISVQAQELSSRGAGIVINYDRDEFASTVIKLLKDRDTLEKYKHNAAEYAKTYISDNIFERAFKQMGMLN